MAYRLDAYNRSLNDAVAAISSLNLGDEKIANLDLANPFPVLFLAPPPKGIQVFWHFGCNVPRDALLEWQDVIGDACVVTIPVQSWLTDSTVRLANIVRPKLTTDFQACISRCSVEHLSTNQGVSNSAASPKSLSADPWFERAHQL